MFQPFKVNKVLLLSLILLFVFSLPAAAKTSDWKNPAYSDYNWAQVKTILVKNPVFSYDYPEPGGTNKNYFEKYPHSENVIMSILSKQIGKLPKYNFINEPAEDTSPPRTQPVEPAKTSTSPEDSPVNAPEPAGDLVLSIKIIDFGWYYEHHEGYWAHESVPKEETIYARDSSGHLREVGKKKSTTMIPVYHPPGYKIKDVAAAEFTLSDAKTGENVWTHTDYRDRDSNKNSWEKDGPESMMNRIFSAAFEKMPLAKK